MQRALQCVQHVDAAGQFVHCLAWVPHGHVTVVQYALQVLQPCLVQFCP